MAIRSRSPIIDQLRWRIAGLFLIFSSLVYLGLTLLSVFLFHAMMTRAIDNNLRLFAGTVGRAISVHDGKPYFRDWLRTVQTEPNRSFVTMQLYDRSQRLLESYGPPRYKELATGKDSVQLGRQTLRVHTSEILFNKQVIGYVQAEEPMDGVEEATEHFAATMAMMAPFVIAGLAATAFAVSSQVVRPFIENVTTLRRFIADAGHELNTPLSIVKARTESLSTKLAKQGASTKELDIIMGSLDRMNKIVSDLMLLTEVEGKLGRQAPQVNVDLEKMTVSLVEEFKERYAQKQVALSCELAAAVVTGYPYALQRLLSNLLDNALKYTEPGGKVSVQLRPGDRSIQIIVEDTGIGIPSESLPHVFDRFYRVDKSRSRASGGVGLGLSIVKAIAEAHNGAVWVESSVGQGSKFFISLPVSA